MKKIILSILTALVFAGLAPTTIMASSDSSHRRNYNCKMPRRDDCRSGERHGNRPGDNSCCERQEARYLFGDLGLSPKQYDRLIKSHVKYQNEIERISRKMSKADPRKAERLRMDAVRAETSFLNEARRCMNPGQYRMFEGRFRSSIPTFHFDSAPRPGHSGVGPVVKGPDPVLMARPH